MKRIAEVRPSSVIVKDRHRTDLGDIGALAASIKEIGLMHPIVCRSVAGKLHLVAGERRLEACKRLGWNIVPVVLVDSIDTAAKALTAERDENQCRKEMTPLELKSLTDALLEIEREAAKERQREHGGTAPGKPADTSDHVVRSVPGGNRAKDAAAKAAGWSRSQYERVERVEKAVDAEDLPPLVQQAAANALEKLETGEMTPSQAERAVKDAKVVAGVGSTAEKIDKAKREAKPEAPAPKTAAATEQRLAEYDDLCRSGYSSRQIAERWGIARESVWDFRKRHGLQAPPADEQINRTRKHDSSRIVRETVASLEGICIGLTLVDLDDIDLEEVDPDYWVSSLSESIRALQALRKNLTNKKELTNSVN